MANLLNTTVATNYQKTSPSTNFGTRALTMITVTVAGTGAPDMTKQAKNAGADTYTSGTYESASSYYSAAVRALQQFAEVFAVFQPSSTAFTALIAADTADTSGSGNTQDGSYDDAEAAIKAALVGVVVPATVFSGTVTVAAVTTTGTASFS